MRASGSMTSLKALLRSGPASSRSRTTVTASATACSSSTGPCSFSCASPHAYGFQRRFTSRTKVSFSPYAFSLSSPCSHLACGSGVACLSRSREFGRWRNERDLSRCGVSGGSGYAAQSQSPEISVDVLLREEILKRVEAVEAAALSLEEDCELALRVALEKTSLSSHGAAESVEVSVMITDDEEIKQLNATWRGIDRPTDVLSFPNGEVPPGYPAFVLGDIIISAETAERQASERGHDIQRELRILLVHGLLHLLEYDHELSEEAEVVMKDEEVRILDKLKWAPDGGLIAKTLEGDNPSSPPAGGEEKTRKVKLVALDMDGTLLNNKVLVSEKNKEALAECERQGITVILATGKARSSALLACQKSGLGEMFSENSPGIFIQGLLVHGPDGKVLSQTYLSEEVVRKAFLYAEEANIACCGFLGDKNVTLKSHPRLDELHERYFEPESYVASSLEEILQQNVYKILFYGDDENIIKDSVKPYWEKNIMEGAKITQAIPEMLELVPTGTSKAYGLEKLLSEFGVTADEMMAVGDGNNDLEMLQLAGIGVAVENATPDLKKVADYVVSSNEDNGAAEAIRKFVLLNKEEPTN